MAKMVNVNREVVDAFYRYKMPLLETKVEGRGNGIKTVIPNMVDVAKALDRSALYTTKWLGLELGAQTRMEVEADRYIVNGAFETVRFQELLDGFIKKFVLCPDCGNPETVLRVTSKKQIEQKCKACGYVGQIPLVHRLTTYIINNPPNEVKGKGKSKPSKEERRKAKNARNKGGSQSSDTGGDGGGGDKGYAAVGQIGAQVDSAKARLGGNIDAPDAVDGDGDDDDWSVDVSEEAVRQRTADLGTGVTSLTQTDDLERPIEDRLKIFQKYVEARVGDAKFPAKDVIGEADRLECKEKGVMVVVELLLSKADDVFVAIKKYQGLFQRFTLENEKCQKYMIGALEVLIEDKPDLLGKAARLFKDLYDKDILDEEVILAWGGKVSKKYVSKELATQIRAKCKPFLDWLAEAEEEESDEDEDMVFAANPEAVLAAEAAKKAEEEAAANPPAEKKDDEDPESEDLDDDDIDNM
jgi:translation initiation factor 5